jgi:orotidine-5'-phosphate decarboxylase
MTGGRVPTPTSTAESLKQKLIIALDVPTAAAATSLVWKIGDAGVFYKVGLQLFAAEGPAVVRQLVASGKKVFLDLKFHDIPNTVAGAVGSAAGLGVTFLTVHAGGGSRMLRAAVEAAHQSQSKTKVLAVTMLTSIGDDDVSELGLSGKLADNVLRLARMAREVGCDGIVASPHEVTAIRKEVGTEMLIVTPGIRPTGTAAGDQIRTATPSNALAAGATHIVVGRPITDAPDLRQAAESILADMARA